MTERAEQGNNSWSGSYCCTVNDKISRTHSTRNRLLLSLLAYAKPLAIVCYCGYESYRHRRHISSYPQMALIRKSSKLNRFAVVGPLRGLIVLLSTTENIDRLETSRCNYTGIENVLSYVAVRRTYVESLEKQSLKEPSSTVSSFIVVENIYVTTVTLICF